jgi:hypothetical protein
MYIIARACIMYSEEMAKKCDLKILKTIAKKINLIKALLLEVMAELEASKA